MRKGTAGIVVTAVAAGLTTFSGAAAQDAPLVRLDTLQVEVASRAVSAFPARSRVVQVLTADDLRALPVRSVQDALAWMTVADVQPRSPAQADLSLRGSSFEQVLVLVDGIRMSDPQTGHFDLDLAVPLDRVERIEVLAGPASALYGADAVGGVVNVVTREGGRGVSASLERGTFDAWRGAAAIDGSSGAVRGSAGVEWSRSDGYRPGTDYENVLVHGGGSAPLGGGRLTVRAGRGSRDFGADNFYGDYPSYEETRTTTASAAWSRDVGAGFSVRPLVSFRLHDDDFVLFRTNPTAYENVHRSRQYGGEILVRRARTDGVALAFGGEMYREDIESENVATGKPALGDRTEDRAAGFAELGWSAARFSASLGVRADHHEVAGDYVSPSLSASADLTPGVRVRASWGRSFRAPTWTERYYTAPNRLGDPALEPETSWTGEAGIDVGLPRSGVLRFTGYVRQSDDLIDWVRPAGSAASVPYQVRNIESATYRGLEVALDDLDVAGFVVDAAASTLSLDADEAVGLTSFYALHPLVARALLGVGRSLAGGRVTVGGRVLRERRRDGEAYVVLGARAGVRVPGGQIDLNATNLTDAVYRPFPEIPRDAAGRALSLAYRLELGAR